MLYWPVLAKTMCSTILALLVHLSLHTTGSVPNMNKGRKDIENLSWATLPKSVSAVYALTRHSSGPCLVRNVIYYFQ